MLGNWHAVWGRGQHWGGGGGGTLIFIEKSSEMRPRELGWKDPNTAGWVSGPSWLVPVISCDSYGRLLLSSTTAQGRGDSLLFREDTETFGKAMGSIQR